MTGPRIILLNDPTRGIDVGTKQEIYQLLRELADRGRRDPVLLDRLRRADRLLRPRAHAYDGAVRRELAGAEITERELIASALNIAAAQAAPARRSARERVALSGRRAPRRRCRPFVVFVLLFAIYTRNHPAGFSANVVQTAANKGVLLAFVAMAQTLLVVHRRHRPVGRHDLHPDQLRRLGDRRRLAADDGARHHRRAGGRASSAARSTARSSSSAACSRSSRRSRRARSISASRCGCGRSRGGDAFNSRSRRRADRPAARSACRPALVALLAVVLLIWVPFRRSVVGRDAYAVGSAEAAAYMSGVPIRRAKFVAYTLAGLLAAHRRAVSDLHHLFRRGVGGAAAALYAVLHRRRRARRRLAVRRHRQRDRRDLRRVHVPHHRRPAVRVRPRSAVAAAVLRASCCCSRSASARRGCCGVRNRLELFG